jgi:hypothetical protein
MRNVEKLYHKLAKLLPERGAFKTQGIQLLEVTSKMTMSKRDAGKFLSGHVAEWQKVPQRLVRRLHSLGAYRNILIDPKAVDKHRSGWRFQYRILAVMPTDWQIPEWLVNNNRKLRVTYVQSKKQLINVVGRTCRYPTGLLQGTPRMAMIALNARRGKRCSEYTGCLRSGGEEEDDDDNGNRKKTSN